MLVPLWLINNKLRYVLIKIEILRCQNSLYLMLSTYTLNFLYFHAPNMYEIKKTRKNELNIHIFFIKNYIV